MRAPVPLAIVALLLLIPNPVVAQETDVTVESGESGTAGSVQQRGRAGDSSTATAPARSASARGSRVRTPPPFYSRLYPGDLDGLPFGVCETAFAIVVFRTSDGTPVRRSCVDDLGDDPAVVPAAGPVVDPTDVFDGDRVPWPATEVMVNPHVFGVVNMDTWVWHDPSADTALDLSVQVEDLVTGAPVTLDVQLEIVGWCHRFDDVRGVRPRFVEAAVECPAGGWATSVLGDDEFGFGPRHVYEERQFATVSVEQRWSGTATLVDGGVVQSWPLGPVTLTHQREYQVNEIISVLR